MGENSNQKNSQLYAYVRFMLLALLILVAVNVGVYLRNFYAGLLMSCGLLVYVIVVAAYYLIKRKRSMPSLIKFVTTFSTMQNRLMDELPFPYALTDDSGRMLWMNGEFKKLTGIEDKKDETGLFELFPEITGETLSESDQGIEVGFDYGTKALRAVIKPAVKDENFGRFTFPDISDEELGLLYAVSVFDDTEILEYRRRYEDEILVPGTLYIDNYDETLETMEEVQRSISTAIIDRKLNQYFNDIDAIIRKYEKDKYLLVMRSKTLNALKDAKFPILTEIKELNIGSEVSVTVSMGIALNQGSYVKNLEASRTGIDLALGRGGDQVVLKDGEGIQYFGGKSLAIEKNTRVKARVKASALREFVDEAERILIMGHKASDIDAFGAAIGIYRASREINKKAHIVVDNPDQSVIPFMESFINDPEYPADIFISGSVAMQMADAQTMLIVVDTCRASYTECPELLSSVKNIVVLDHHRQSSDVIRNTVLSYIEPYASSTCEMVAEIIQYFEEGLKLRNIEADAMYAGIVIDTNNFVQRTGVRTFEAAAYLRRSGADMTRVRKLFREDLNDYQSRGEVLRNVKMFREHYAISSWEAANELNPAVVGAQAANDLLNINGVKASFVLTKFGGAVYISARAIDEVNVQLIMERLGGGGHINVAGCQLYGATLEEAEEKLKGVIADMDDGGES